MSQYLIDFNAMTAGQTPSGMTRRWATTGSGWTVTNTAAKDGTSKGLIGPPTGDAAGRRLLSFDLVDSDTERDTVEIYAQFKSTSGNNDARFIIRGQNAAGNESGYGAGIGNAIIREMKYENGTATDLDSQAWTTTPGSWYHLLVRLDNVAGVQRLRTKVWLDGDAEPGPFQRNYNLSGSSEIAGAGWVGLFQNSTGVQITWDRYIGVATGGDVAPRLPSDLPGIGASAGSDQTDIEPYSIVNLTASSTNTTSPIYTWNQLSGTPVTLSGTGASRTFKAPGTLNGETLNFQVTVTESSNTATDTCSVTVYGVNERIRRSGSWDPIEIIVK